MIFFVAGLIVGAAIAFVAGFAVRDWMNEPRPPRAGKWNDLPK